MLPSILFGEFFLRGLGLGLGFFFSEHFASGILTGFNWCFAGQRLATGLTLHLLLPVQPSGIGQMLLARQSISIGVGGQCRCIYFGFCTGGGWDWGWLDSGACGDRLGLWSCGRGLLSNSFNLWSPSGLLKMVFFCTGLWDDGIVSIEFPQNVIAAGSRGLPKHAALGFVIALNLRLLGCVFSYVSQAFRNLLGTANSVSHELRHHTSLIAHQHVRRLEHVGKLVPEAPGIDGKACRFSHSTPNIKFTTVFKRRHQACCVGQTRQNRSGLTVLRLRIQADEFVRAIGLFEGCCHQSVNRLFGRCAVRRNQFCLFADRHGTHKLRNGRLRWVAIFMELKALKIEAPGIGAGLLHG